MHWRPSDIPWCGHLGANQHGCIRCAITRLEKECDRRGQRIKELGAALRGLLGILDSSKGAMMIGALHGEGLASKEESAMADATITKARALCSEGEGE